MAPATPVKDVFDTVGSLWRLFEPTARGKFEQVDLFLLRNCIKTVFDATNLNPAAPDEFGRRVDAMISSAGPNSDPINLKNFLLWNLIPKDPAPITLAQATDSLSSPLHHLQVISRAGMLLRIASGASVSLLRSGGVSLRSLTFWWSALGENRGLWTTGDAPADPNDLWVDVQQALDKLDAHLPAPGAMSVLKDKRTTFPLEISVLGECERIALWGLNA